MEVAAKRDTLPGRVIGVTFSQPASVAAFAERLALGIPILCDPMATSYATFGFGRTGGTALLHARFWRRLFVALGRRRRLFRSGEDYRQLGGDAVLDAEQRLRWLYRSRYPSDRPTLADVRRALERAAREP